MWKLIVLTLTTLNMQASSATATSSATDVKTRAAAHAGYDVKARAAADVKSVAAGETAPADKKRKTEEILRAQKLPADVSELITEYVFPVYDVATRQQVEPVLGEDVQALDVATLIAEYAHPLPVEALVEEASGILREIYEAVSSNMPAREQLHSVLHPNPRNFQERLLSQLVSPERLRNRILANLLSDAVTPERQARWEHFIKRAVAARDKLYAKNKEAHDDYKAQRDTWGVPWPHNLDIKKHWEETGFEHYPKLQPAPLMKCGGKEGCGNAETLLPCIEPQYFHAPGCRKFARVSNLPQFKKPAYGDDIPVDVNDYYRYTMGFLVMYMAKEASNVHSPNHQRASVMLDTFTMILVNLPEWQRAEQYVNLFDPKSDQKTRNELYRRIVESHENYHKLWNIGLGK